MGASCSLPSQRTRHRASAECLAQRLSGTHLGACRDQKYGKGGKIIGKSRAERCLATGRAGAQQGAK